MNCQCPNCQRLLREPEEAANQFARCPGCRTTFKVAPHRATNDDTAFGWLMEDAEAASQAFQALLFSKIRRPAPATAKP